MSASAGERVLCRKCGQANSKEEEICERCGHSLYVVCHCGARNARSNDRCDKCGDKLRRRRIDPGDPIFEPSVGLAFAPACSQSRAGDLGVALLMFAIVGLIYGTILLYPTFQAYQEEREADRQEAELARRSHQERQEATQLELRRQAVERARQTDPFQKWINR
jgi:hypothetical protein